MRFERDEFSFELLIVGYQFPELAEAEYDSNWLNVKIVVRHPEGDWSALDPALLTYEVRELAEWLCAVGSGRRDTREMAFLEPCLLFKVRSGDERTDELEIELSYEFRPPWAKDIDQSAVILFPLNEVDLSSAADSLEHQLTRYPQRGERYYREMSESLVDWMRPDKRTHNPAVIPSAVHVTYM